MAKMNLDQFATAVSRGGYGTKKLAKEYAKRTGKAFFTDDDFVEVYHFAQPWAGCAADKGLRKVYGSGGGKTTAINHQRYNSGRMQDWVP